MSIQMLTAVWGPKHLELFKKGTIRSLAQQDNYKALVKAQAQWNIFTEPQYFDTIKNYIYEVMPNFPSVELKSTSLLRDRIDNLLSATLWQMGRCLDSNERMLLAPPDTIFGDGTIDGLLQIGKDEHSCVVVPHPRVLPNILDSNFGTNAELVSLAWKNLHRSWSEAEDGHPRQSSFIGGVSWRSISDNLYAVKHRLPTVYLAHFTQNDYQYFVKQIGYGAWDHTWPEELLKQSRQRTVGASDAAFIVEVTDGDKNVPPVMRGGDPNKFWKNHFHNEINSQISCIFRGASL